jgi:ketosteroid isomerase-like protein
MAFFPSKEAGMRSVLGKWLMRWAYTCQNQGRFDAPLRLFADDVTLEFPGTSRWSRTYRSKAELREFMAECYRLGLVFTVHDVFVKGWPWNMTIAVVLSDRAGGEIAYGNRAVEIWKARWGRVVSGELFEDTEKSLDWSNRLAAAHA